ncbi:MAG: response regulator, partial [Syntrophales bacterium LBB04]|nr:response regulator [Syntrophales bacterium LBB04]
MRGKPVILAVDDQLQNIELIDAYLSPHGYEIVRAESGETAMQAIAENAMDLVLLDVMMPKINGFEVCKRIKENERLRSIPVIMITALSAKEDRIKGIDAGAEDFISKPIDKGELLARVKMLLKMKMLNDRLNHAYEEINDLTNFGEASILSFDPLKFDFLTKVDTIIHQIIRTTSARFDKPQYVIVGIADEHYIRQWYLYQYLRNTLERDHLAVDVLQGINKRGSSRILFY